MNYDRSAVWVELCNLHLTLFVQCDWNISQLLQALKQNIKLSDRWSIIWRPCKTAKMIKFKLIDMNEFTVTAIHSVSVKTRAKTSLPSTDHLGSRTWRLIITKTKPLRRKKRKSVQEPNSIDGCLVVASRWLCDKYPISISDVRVSSVPVWHTNLRN